MPLAAGSAAVALGSLGHQDEVAAAVAFLASADAAYLTGQDPVVDGGLVGSVPAAWGRVSQPSAGRPVRRRRLGKGWCTAATSPLPAFCTACCLTPPHGG
ncbi:SDR family oxidoreductase [Streptomyces sp. NPDC015125]|uniref:SDR family oxidoreductase n=1 Tax=Streptomyces sp. NPDC015125 TaxID=3364938 RepID=UPI0036F66EAC